LIVKRLDALSPSQQEALLPYLAKPCPSTCLVFVAEKIDQRKKFFQTFKTHGETVPCQPLKESQIPAWIKQQARHRKLAMTEETIAYLAERVGPDLMLLANELTKLSLAVGPDRPVQIQDLKAVMGPQQMPSIFDLTRAIGERNSGEAVRLLDALLLGGEAPLKILAMLIRHVRQMWLAKTLKNQGASPAEIAQEVGIPSFFISELLTQTQRYTLDEIELAYRDLLATDSRLKRSRAEPQFLLEDLILKLCRSQKDGRPTVSGLL
jgi:DNA polymerase-3 subunit delta